MKLTLTSAIVAFCALNPVQIVLARAIEVNVASVKVCTSLLLTSFRRISLTPFKVSFRFRAKANLLPVRLHACLQA